MKSTHCVIDGKLCSDCCKVLTIRESKNFRDWRKYVRRWGYPDDFKQEHHMYHMVRKISKRRAKKINKKLVLKVKNNQSYFTCKNYQNGQCQIYDKRPHICSGYPLYGKSNEDWKKYLTDTENLIGLYRPDCTYYNQENF